jgi:hypothetical protein
MSKRPATSASVFVPASVVAGLLGVVVTGATVDSDPDPDELHALATITVVRSAIPNLGAVRCITGAFLGCALSGRPRR